MKYKKLSKYAKDNGISYITAYRHYKNNLIKNIKKLSTNTILVGYDEENNKTNTIRAIVYSRVSSNDMKDNLKRQKEILEDYCIAKGYNIIKSISEISSGMNDNRPKLKSILKMNNFDVIVVEYKDRLTRFGFNYIKTLLEKDNKKIEIVNKANNDNENLVEDLISIIYSFSARMYGKRKYKQKTKKIIEEIKKNNK